MMARSLRILAVCRHNRTRSVIMGGLLEHARAFVAVTNPLVNSYKRLVPGYEAPVYAAWSASNRSALKLFGGGDTLQELRRLCPGAYLSGLDDPSVYYFTGGGSVLEAIAQGSAYKLKPVDALMG